MKKIKEEELQQLINLQSTLKDLIFNLGEINYEKIILKQKEKKLQENLNNLKEEENTLQQFLIQKYGDGISIDLTTGEYK